jgi:hypothetical protein
LQAKWVRRIVAGLVDIHSGKLIDLFDTTPICGAANCVLPSVGAIEGLRISRSGKLEPLTIGIDPFSLPWLGIYWSRIQREPTIFDFNGSGKDQHLTIASDDRHFVCEMGINGKTNCPYNKGYSEFNHLSAGNEYYSYGVCDPRLFTGLYGEYGQGKNVFSLEPNPGCSNRVRFFGYSPQFDVVLYVIQYEYGTQGNKLFLYDIANQKYINSWKYPLVNDAISRNFSYGLVSPNGRFAAILLDRRGTTDQVMVYDLDRKELIINELLKDSFENFEPSLAFSADGKILAMLSPGTDLSIHILTPNALTKPLHFELSSSLPKSYCSGAVGFAISPDASLLAIGCKGEILLVDATNGTVVNKIKAHTGPIVRLAFNEDGSLLASLERSGIVKIWGIAP